MRITKYKKNFFKGYAENWPREIFFIDSVLKTNLWPYIIKNINEEKKLQSLAIWAIIQNHTVILATKLKTCQVMLVKKN